MPRPTRAAQKNASKKRLGVFVAMLLLDTQKLLDRNGCNDRNLGTEIWNSTRTDQAMQKRPTGCGLTWLSWMLLNTLRTDQTRCPKAIQAASIHRRT